MTDSRYPTGKFEWKGPHSQEVRVAKLKILEETPQKFRAAMSGLNDLQLDTPYREGGWTVRQLIHHVPDSHLNAYCRTKLALTEENPVIKPYLQDKWAETIDFKLTPIETSLSMLENIHTRWLTILNSLKPEEFQRAFIHPEYPDAPRTIDWLVGLYSWHGPHHTAHITELRKRMGW